MGRKYHDEQWLRQRYKVEKKSSTEIARAVGVSKNTILRWLDKHDIETRSRGPDKGAEFGDSSKLKDEEWLREQYVEKEKSTRQIARELDVGNQTVLNWLNNHGIETRGQWDVRHGMASRKNPKLEDEEWLREQYEDSGRSMSDIARELDVTPPSVKYRLDKYDIERRNDASHGMTGDKVFQRDPEWDSKRERRLEIDNRTCQDCGIPEEEYYRGLDIHHLTKRQEFVDSEGNVDWDAANSMDNMVSLCQSCHMGRHHEKE